MATYIVRNYGDGTYLVAFDDDEIHTTVTASGAVADEWLELIQAVHRRRLHRLVVGIDVEWRPNFEAGADPNPVAVVQICVGRRCLVFQILRCDFIPDSLFDFVSDERFTFVGVGIGADAEKLSDEYGLELGDLWDLRELAAERTGRQELARLGLQNLVRAVMGVHVEKPRRVRLSAWDAPVLSLEQIGYACADAFASFEVGRRLISGEF